MTWLNHLVTLRVSGEFARHTLSDESNLVQLGRDPACALVLSSPGLSRRHLEIERRGLETHVRDLGSSNGTTFNGVALSPGEWRALRRGDVLLCGDVLVAQGCNALPLTGDDEPLRTVAEMYAPSMPHLDEFLAQLAPDGISVVSSRTGRCRFVGQGDLQELQVRLRVISQNLDSLGHSAQWQLGASDDTTPPRRPSRTMMTVPPAAVEGSDWSSAMTELHRLIALVAPTDMNVLVLGETGTGKEVVSKRMHDASKRSASPFVALNCAALSEQLFESEIFGHEKGAFTGAHANKVGLIESAGDGTLFLDEVGELPLGAQAKLLRVLEQRTYMRVGSTQLRPMHARVISATNRNLQSEMASGAFRSDLYFRLNGMSLHIPPLRDRKPEEIARLMLGFLAEAATRQGRSIPFLTEEASSLLLSYRWPGNVRELRAVAERAMLLSTGMTIEAKVLRPMLTTVRMSERTMVTSADAVRGVRAHITEDDHTGTPPPTSAVEVIKGDWSPSEVAERQKVKEALERAMHNQTTAAAELGLTRRALIGRIEKYDLPRPRKTS